MKSYLRMKYEMFLMRLYDFVVKLLSKTRCDWYPKEPYQDEIDKLQDKVWELEDKVWELEEKLMDTKMEYEREFDSYEYWHEVQDDQIERLWQWLEFYNVFYKK